MKLLDSKKKQLAFVLVLAALGWYGYCKFFGKCCWVNYESSVSKVATPLRDRMVVFYKTHKRAPTLEEKVMLLEEIGCENIEPYGMGSYNPKPTGHYCTFLKRKYRINLEDSFLSTPIRGTRLSGKANGYLIRVAFSKSICRTGLYFDGEPEEVSCFTMGCINLSH